MSIEITTDIITIASRKGGTGKTTSVFNLAYCLSGEDRKVLIIDLDSQCNLTDTVTINDNVNNTIYNVINNEVNIKNSIYETNIKNIDVIPASVELANLEVELSDNDNREYILKEKLEDIRGIYDYILIDTAPSLDTLVVNSLVASDYALITVRTSLYSFKGIEQVVELVNLIKKGFNPGLKILGMLVTQIDKRTKISKEFINDLKAIYGDKVFDNSISQNVAIVESTLEGLPVALYDNSATSSKQYMSLAKEIKERSFGIG